MNCPNNRSAPITCFGIRRDFPIAVVEAKAAYRTAGDGLQQAKEYAQILGLKFAYATNGQTIIEHDFLTGLDNELQAFPTAAELWNRLRNPLHLMRACLLPSTVFHEERAIARSCERNIARGSAHNGELARRSRILLPS
jgi:type I restriction enzyme, R subunit